MIKLERCNGITDCVMFNSLGQDAAVFRLFKTDDILVCSCEGRSLFLIMEVTAVFVFLFQSYAFKVA